jgi:betaine lipid synthase
MLHHHVLLHSLSSSSTLSFTPSPPPPSSSSTLSPSLSHLLFDTSRLQPDRVDDSDDRVGMYWTTWIAHLKNVKVVYEERVDTQQQKSSLDNFLTGIKVVTFPLWRPIITLLLQKENKDKKEDNTHRNNMEGFYRYQKQDYDSFRENLLHAKSALMESLPLNKSKSGKGDLVWVDVGGGTARNLEYFTLETIRQNFKKIYIVDISASLLEVARARVITMGLQDIVVVVEHDFTDSSVFTVLPAISTADIVTFSYSFSMIPKQQVAMTTASKLLKKGGIVAIADFFLKGNYDDCLPPLSKSVRGIESLLHKKWFELDHVHLLGDTYVPLSTLPSSSRI